MLGNFLAQLFPIDSRSMFAQADADPSAAFSYISLITVFFVTEDTIDTIFGITVYRGGYFVLITSSRGSDSSCGIESKITILAS